MLRASAVAEAVGVPSSSLVCDGFLSLAAATSIGQGMPNLPLAVVPGHPNVQNKQALRDNILGITLPQVINDLLEAPEAASEDREPGARDIIVKGSFDEINDYFYDNELSDGLPIVPPTLDRIEAFLRFTERDPGEVLSILLPDSRAVTIWSIAVNGVMAGCRPEYMPVLIAVVEAMSDPYYGVEHAGSTPGGDTLIILNGPIIKELGFNYTQGVMRDGFRPNTSVGRFWRLFMRNVVGFLPHRNDKATFGNTWRVVVAENEDVVAKLGWEPNSVDMGFETGTNTVTIARYTGGNHISSVSGSTPEAMMPYLADAMKRQISWQLGFTIGGVAGTLRPMLMLSPILAETFAAGGWTKIDIQRALFEMARIPAWEAERLQRDWCFKPHWNIAQEVKMGRLAKVFGESDDPNRLVPLVWEAEDYMVLVTGDLGRNSAYVFAPQGVVGYPTCKKIVLPSNWNEIRLNAEEGKGRTSGK